MITLIEVNGTYTETFWSTCLDLFIFSLAKLSTIILDICLLYPFGVAIVLRFKSPLSILQTCHFFLKCLNWFYFFTFFLEVLPKFVPQLADVIFQVSPLPFTALSTHFNYLSEFIMVQKFTFILSIFCEHCFLSFSLSSSCAFLWSWILMHHIVGAEIVLSNYTNHFHNLFSLTFQNDDCFTLLDMRVFYILSIFFVFVIIAFCWFI